VASTPSSTGILAIGRLADDLDLRLKSEHGFQSAAGAGTVVGDQHSRLHRHPVGVLGQAGICQTLGFQGAGE